MYTWQYLFNSISNYLIMYYKRHSPSTLDLTGTRWWGTYIVVDLTIPGRRLTSVGRDDGPAVESTFTIEQRTLHSHFVLKQLTHCGEVVCRDIYSDITMNSTQQVNLLVICKLLGATQFTCETWRRPNVMYTRGNTCSIASLITLFVLLATHLYQVYLAWLVHAEARQ